MFFLTPKYIKQARLLHKGVTRFLDYKRDLLPQAKLDEITGLRDQLEQATKARDQKRLPAIANEINRACERALPESRSSAVAENIEVFFVSIVIALGIRSYIAQPFQIPTGSMQPTLNGIRAERTDKDPDPGILGKALGWVTGTSYINVVSDHDGELDRREPLTEDHLLIFRPYCYLNFQDGHRIKINCPKNQLLLDLRLAENIAAHEVAADGVTADMRRLFYVRGGERIRQGQLLARGIVHNGDHVIVNKFIYHFRKPTRGEVFVFTTKNIGGISIPDGQGSQHYIKRLAGTPGDLIEIRVPQGEQLWPNRPEYWKYSPGQEPQRLGCELWVNGHKATEPGFVRVMARNEPGYNGYTQRDETPFKIKLDEEDNQRRYLALGDNSANSSDGRYWGTVPEQNAVGPGWFCYWPLTAHFGLIR